MMEEIEDPAVRRTFRRHLHAIIRRHAVVNRFQEIFNFPLLNGQVSLEILMQMVEDIFNLQLHPFHLNFAFGFVLDSVDRHSDDGDSRDDDEDDGGIQPRYFHPYRNTHVLNNGIRIFSYRDVQRLRSMLEKMSLIENLEGERPDTKWFMNLLTNVRFVVTKLNPSVPLGCSRVNLPFFLKRKRSLLDFPSSNSLCFFNCLAYHKGSRRNQVQRDGLKLFSTWAGDRWDVDDFPGVSCSDFDDLERLFQVNITVFSLQPDDRAHTIHASCSEYESTLYLNLWENHLSLVTKPDAFTSRYVCECCGRSFRFNSSCIRHCKQQICLEQESGNTTVSSDIRGDPTVPRKYVGGYLKEEPGLFQRLKEAGISTSDKESHKWFACFDIECLLKDVPDQIPEAKSQRISEHECVSIAVCSNVPNFLRPVCFVGPEPRDLVRQMLDYLGKVQEEASRLMREQLSATFSALAEKMEELRDQGDPDGMLKTYEVLLDHLTSYCQICPVLGYNSSRYDVIVIQEFLLPELNLDSDPKAYVSKKNSSYMCIRNSFFIFLDLLLFLSPGTSLSAFIKAYRGNDEDLAKSFFPYEIMKKYEDLETLGFPSYESFFSKLKNQNTLESSRIEYEKLLESGYTKEMAMKKMEVTTEPPTGEQEYHLLHQVWI